MTIYVKAKPYSMYIGPKQMKIPHFIMLKSVRHNIVLVKGDQANADEGWRRGEGSLNWLPLDLESYWLHFFCALCIYIYMYQFVWLSPLYVFKCLLKPPVCKGGVAVTEAVKILALPRRGGSDPCQFFFGEFVTVHRG